MRINDFDVYAALLKEKSGLTLTPDKSYLIESRLTPVSKEWGFESLEAMTVALNGVPDPGLVKDVVEAMTTNETSFFRDNRPFDTFKATILPFMKEARATQKSLRIWCAACSSGQEPYSLAMLLEDMKAEMPGWNYEIVATDIDHKIIEHAKRAEYTQFEVQRGLPIQMLMNYFEQDGQTWRLKDIIKNKIQFKYFNLLDSMSSIGQFDIIFCRNVLIYFDVDTKRATLDKLLGQIASDGFLFLGGAETVMGITKSFIAAPDLRGVYVPEAHPFLASVEDSATKTIAG
ncbi:MAG: protein-glutamate O-methyltransferase CheR [Pseudomonadota bacterium]